MDSRLAIISSEPRAGTLAAAWAAAGREQRAALIPYLTAGHPDFAESLAALRVADELADIIEVGVPFSDPLADGATIQRSTFDALAQGMTLVRTLDLVRQAQLERPIVIFSYLNPILRYGVDRFLDDAAELGIAGLLLTDLPAGSDEELERAIRASPLALIRLVAPTTPDARLGAIVSAAEGFIYLIARLGVTGVSAAVDVGVGPAIARVRAHSELPVAVGFGISTPAQAAEVARVADGVVVGSALVDIVGREGAAGARRFLGALRGAMRRELP